MKDKILPIKMWFTAHSPNKSDKASSLSLFDLFYDQGGHVIRQLFYINLIATIVSFGCYVASGSLSDIFTEVELRPVAALAAGISIVQLVELFDSMFDYYQAARLGI